MTGGLYILTLGTSDPAGIRLLSTTRLNSTHRSLDRIGRDGLHVNVNGDGHLDPR